LNHRKLGNHKTPISVRRDRKHTTAGNKIRFVSAVMGAGGVSELHMHQQILAASGVQTQCCTDKVCNVTRGTMHRRTHARVQVLCTQACPCCHRGQIA
jgi:hypothetical protein